MFIKIRKVTAFNSYKFIIISVTYIYTKSNIKKKCYSYYVKIFDTYNTDIIYSISIEYMFGKAYLQSPAFKLSSSLLLLAKLMNTWNKHIHKYCVSFNNKYNFNMFVTINIQTMHTYFYVA